MKTHLDLDKHLLMEAMRRGGHGTTPRSTIDCIIAQTCLKSDQLILAWDRDYQAITQVAPLRVVVAP